jgi:hypothetical protein
VGEEESSEDVFDGGLLLGVELLGRPELKPQVVRGVAFGQRLGRRSGGEDLENATGTG